MRSAASPPELPRRPGGRGGFLACRRGPGGISAPAWRLLRNGILGFTVLVGAGVVALSVHVAFRDMHVFPFWDMGGVHHVYFSRPARDFFVFRDNEHLPIAVMPLFLADAELFRARGISLVAGILLLNAMIVALLADAYRRHAPRSTAHLVMVSALFAANMFWLIHYENLIWPKQIHMYMAAGLTLLAFRALAGVEGETGGVATFRRGRLIAACVLMTLATFSFAYGAVGWIAAILLALSRRWPARLSWVLFAAFVANMATYALFFNMRTLENHTNPILAIGRPLQVTEYLVHYFSAPVTTLLRTVLAEPLAHPISLWASALAVLAALAGIVHQGLLGSRRPERLAQFACLLLLFTLGAGTMTALSRLDFGTGQSQAPRYAIIQVLFWNGLTLLFAARFGHWVRMQAGVLAGLCLFTSVLLVPSQAGIARWSREHAEDHWTAVLAIINGVDDDEIVTTRIFPVKDVVVAVTRGLAVRGWSVFSRPQPWWIGRPASALFADAPADRCLGSFDTASDLGRIADGTYVDGWAWDVKAQAAPEWVVLLDEEGIVRSLARGGLARPDVGRVHPAVAGSRPGWRGYAAAKDPLARYEAFAVLGDGATICPLGTHADTPQGRSSGGGSGT